MPDLYYWTIDYEIEHLSDFHVGDGTILLGGNLHGLRMDENGFPYMPHTQVRGLLKKAALQLAGWQIFLGPLIERNFPSNRKNSQKIPWWSYTRAGYCRDYINRDSMGYQSHILKRSDKDPLLFSYQKAGSSQYSLSNWQGTVYSVEPASEIDVAFMIMCMRADDRIGARRSRGYGKVQWKVDRINRFKPGDETLDQVEKDLGGWVDVLFSSDTEILQDN